MRKTKYFYVSLSLILALSFVIAACGSGQTTDESSSNSQSADEEQVTIKFANWVSAEDATKENVSKVIEAFEQEHPNVTVENVAIPFDQMRQQLLTMTAGGNPPDVMMLNGPWSQELGAQGALLDLTEIAGEDYLNDNWPGALDAGKYKDQLYAVPFGLSPHAFWYNKDLMEKAGLDPENPPKTMDELNEAMAQIKDKLGPDGVYPIGLDTSKIDYALVHFWPWFYAFDARPLYNDESNFNTAEVKNALEWMRQAVKNEYTSTGLQIKELRELMAKDNIVFQMDGPYLVGILRSLNPELEGDAFYEKFGVTTVPVGDNGKSETLADLHQLGISAESEHQEIAWEFVKFLTSSETSINDYQIPYGVIPPLKSSVQDNEQLSDPVSQAYINEIFSTMVGGPYGPEYGQAQQLVIQAMQEAALSDKPIEDIVRETDEQLSGIYGQ